MRQIKLFVLLIIAMIAGSAQLASAQDIVEILVSQYNAPEVRSQMLSDGTFSSFTCVRSGNDIVLNFTFADDEVNFSEFTEEEKAGLLNELSESFVGAFQSGDSDGEAVRKMLRDNKVRFVFHFDDRYGNKLSHIEDTGAWK